jgi:excinuclease ABC subunit A
MAEMPCMRIRGACEHNLKNINIDIPKNKLVVMTGISGSYNGIA